MHNNLQKKKKRLPNPNSSSCSLSAILPYYHRPIFLMNQLHFINNSFKTALSVHDCNEHQGLPDTLEAGNPSSWRNCWNAVEYLYKNEIKQIESLFSVLCLTESLFISQRKNLFNPTENQRVMNQIGQLSAQRFTPLAAKISTSD